MEEGIKNTLSPLPARITFCLKIEPQYEFTKLMNSILASTTRRIAIVWLSWHKAQPRVAHGSLTTRSIGGVGSYGGLSLDEDQ
jgi:hypothetical protein